MSPDLKTALDDLAEAIQSITLGSVEVVVIQEAGKTLIQNWNDHHDTKIDEELELHLRETSQPSPHPSLKAPVSLTSAGAFGIQPQTPT